MNYRNPSATDLETAEGLFFQQMKKLTLGATRPAATIQLLQSLDLQFSDQWV